MVQNKQNRHAEEVKKLQKEVDDFQLIIQDKDEVQAQLEAMLEEKQGQVCEHEDMAMELHE